MKAKIDYEARFHFALLQIAAYMSPGQLRRQAQKEYGLSFEESLEMAYENIQDEAKAALRGYRKKKPKPAPAADAVARSDDREHEPSTRD